MQVLDQYTQMLILAGGNVCPEFVRSSRWCGSARGVLAGPARGVSAVAHFGRIFFGGRPTSPVIEGPRAKRAGSSFFAFPGKSFSKSMQKCGAYPPGFLASGTIGSWKFHERCALLLRLGRNMGCGFSWLGMSSKVKIPRRRRARSSAMRRPEHR